MVVRRCRVDRARHNVRLPTDLLNCAGTESETAVTAVRTALVNHPKIIVTAHTAWLSVEARVALQAKAIEQALACLNGEIPYGLVNRKLA